MVVNNWMRLALARAQVSFIRAAQMRFSVSRPLMGQPTFTNQIDVTLKAASGPVAGRQHRLIV